MVLTRWSNNSGTTVDPISASVWGGVITLPILASTVDINMHSAIDADLGAVFIAIPFRVVAGINWRISCTLIVNNLSSKSIFQSNPPRRKLGVATYAQGVYALNNEPINYENSILKQQAFIFMERTGEPSSNNLPTPVIPEGRDFYLSPSSFNANAVSNGDVNYGCTRGQLYFEPGIVGFIEATYTANLLFTLVQDVGSSFTVSQV